MDSVLNFFKEFRDRFSSPLFSSFVIAWLLLNWEVPLYLFFYDFEKLKIDGYSSYYDMIIKNVHTSNGLVIPIISALVYTFLFPGLRNLNVAANAWYKRWGNNWYFKISKESFISVSKYMDLRKKYEEAEKELSKIIQEDSTHLENSLKYQQDLKDALERSNMYLQERNEAFAKIGPWELSEDSNMLDGKWYFKTSSHKFVLDQPFIVKEGLFYVKEDSVDAKYQLIFFLKNPVTRKLKFVINVLIQGVISDTYYCFDLSSVNENSMYSGTVNLHPIVITRIIS